VILSAPRATCLPSPIQEIHDARLGRRNIRLLLKRDDLISRDLPGNKWRKLKYNLERAAEEGHETLLTFGGAYSNHIRATAAAGRRYGFETIGVIRGEELERRPLNDSLQKATADGMRLAYLDRVTYRRKRDPGVIAQLQATFGDFYLLPEGGSNPLAVRGCAEIPAEVEAAFDVICCPCGTGGTLAGVAAGLQPGQEAIGFAVLKGAGFLYGEVADLQQHTFGREVGDWRISLGHHFGGYAKRSAILDRFIQDFWERHGLLLDWVYVAKMMYGIFAMAANGEIPVGSTVVAVITGRPS
jgi:1-aminocyclopropane-1-carboxylate deaminase